MAKNVKYEFAGCCPKRDAPCGWQAQAGEVGSALFLMQMGVILMQSMFLMQSPPFGRPIAVHWTSPMDVQSDVSTAQQTSYQGRLSARIRTPCHRPPTAAGSANSAMAALRSAQPQNWMPGTSISQQMSVHRSPRESRHTATS